MPSALLSVLLSTLERTLQGFGRLLWRVGLDRGVIRLRRRAVRVLLYHAVAPEEPEAIAGLHTCVSADAFRQQVEFLASRYNIVSLPQLLAADCPDRALLLTFDDGYRCLAEHVLPLLRERGLPAVVFLVTDTLSGRPLWNDALHWHLRHGPDADRRALADVVRVDPTTGAASILSAAVEQYPEREIRAMLDGAPDAARACDGLYLSWADVEAWSRAGITFGSHTHTHANLRQLDAGRLREELTRSRRIIAERLGTCDAVAFPFGSGAARECQFAADAGYRSVVQVWGSKDTLAPHHLTRLPVKTASVADLFATLELAGPLKAALSRWRRAPKRRDA